MKIAGLANMQALAIAAFSLVLTLPGSLASATVHHRAHQPDQDAEAEASQLADQINQEMDQWSSPPATLPAVSMTAQKVEVKKQAQKVEDKKVEEKKQAPPEVAVQADAANAKEAADVAKHAATFANKVAEHSMHITKHAKKALGHALGALHDARVDTQGLSKTQKDSLKKAEARLREATKKAEYGKLKKLEEKDAVDIQKEQMQDKISKKKKLTKEAELEQMRVEIRQLREELKAKGGDEEIDKDLQELESMVGKDDASNDEVKAEIERIREQINKMESKEGTVEYDIPKAKGVDNKADDADEEEKEELMRDVQIQPLEKKAAPARAPKFEEKFEATPIQEKGIDIDTQMPYGDLEPFGREDTAQELTESSVRESDEMVDQLERAEVAEEKRAVFRALTRLRGAAITSFDGVARSQTGNIDEYNKVHKWRKTHPLHHLADEESDVTKWAFPDNADFLQETKKGLPAKH